MLLSKYINQVERAEEKQQCPEATPPSERDVDVGSKEERSEAHKIQSCLRTPYLSRLGHP
jgi:hypothetical protein